MQRWAYQILSKHFKTTVKLPFKDCPAIVLRSWPQMDQLGCTTWGSGSAWVAQSSPSNKLQDVLIWQYHDVGVSNCVVNREDTHTGQRKCHDAWCSSEKRQNETAMSIWNIHKYYGNGYINGYCPMSTKPLSKLNTSMPAILLPQVPRSQHQDNLLPQRSSEGPPVAAWWAVRACHYINVYQNSKVDTFKMFKAENPWDLDTWSRCENSAGLI